MKSNTHVSLFLLTINIQHLCYFAINNRDLTFRHQTLHRVRALWRVSLQMIQRPGEVRLEVPVKVHHVERQVLPVPARSLGSGEAARGPQNPPVPGSLGALVSQQRQQQRCVQRDAQRSSEWARHAFRTTFLQRGRLGVCPFSLYIYKPSPTPLSCLTPCWEH